MKHAIHSSLPCASFLFGALWLCGSDASAQSWCPPGAHWLFDTGSPWSTVQTLRTYAQDTVIDGYTAQRIDYSFRLIEFGGIDTLIEAIGTAGYTRYEEEVVDERVDGGWDTLYWFGAVPGDEWAPSEPVENICGQVFHVLDTSSTIIDGVQLRVVSGEMREAGASIEVPFSITERIGGGWGGSIFPWLPTCGIIECYCALLCYSDQEIATSPGGECEITLSAAEAGGNTVQRLFPNPGTDRFTIQWNTPGPTTIQVRDAMWRIVRTGRYTNTSITVDASAWPPGLYHVVVSDVAGAVRVMKWLKE